MLRYVRVRFALVVVFTRSLAPTHPSIHPSPSYHPPYCFIITFQRLRRRRRQRVRPTVPSRAYREIITSD